MDQSHKLLKAKEELKLLLHEIIIMDYNNNNKFFKVMDLTCHKYFNNNQIFNKINNNKFSHRIIYLNSFHN